MELNVRDRTVCLMGLMSETGLSVLWNLMSETGLFDMGLNVRDRTVLWDLMSETGLSVLWD